MNFWNIQIWTRCSLTCHTQLIKIVTLSLREAGNLVTSFTIIYCLVNWQSRDMGATVVGSPDHFMHMRNSRQSRITKSCMNIQQCIVDECGMCLEPESLVPITSSRARQVVLIGDHKQLQPIIQDRVAKTLGLGISMFERLSRRAMMLEIQYRMVRWNSFIHEKPWLLRFC